MNQNQTQFHLMTKGMEQMSLLKDEAHENKKKFLQMQKRFLYAENCEMQINLSQVQTKIEQK